MRQIASILVVLTAAISCSRLWGRELPSWNASASRSAIVEFVGRVTDPAHKDFVPERERIAVFDNDGTLWGEQPMYVQLAFAVDRVRELADKHPEWKEQQPFQAALAGDMERLRAGGHKALAKLLAATHAGMTTAEFQRLVTDWIATARHPKTKRPYTEMTYQPMLEVLGYLRSHGFRTYVVSGGGIEFIRPWAHRTYGIPPEQVIGSRLRTKFTNRNGKPVLMRLPEFDFVNDRSGKPVAIQQFIGRRPIAAFGNSDGDLEMLQWTAAGDRKPLCVLIHHTDAEREWAYDRNSSIGRLDKALDEARRRNWAIVNMKTDWAIVHAAEHPYLHKQAVPSAADWSYSGPTGPARWGELSPDYVLAKIGRQQSPIDIRSAALAPLRTLKFDYRPSRIHLINNGHTVQENEDPGSFGMAGEVPFELQQFHFHSPSEHTVDGNHFPMEMHLVHKAEDGTIGVVAVFIREGEQNPAFDPIWRRLPSAGQPMHDAEAQINTRALLPKELGYYLYRGSFTTPPCTEQVRWVVLKTPVSMSKTQIARFRMLIEHNNRPIQPLNGRKILRSR